MTSTHGFKMMKIQDLVKMGLLLRRSLVFRFAEDVPFAAQKVNLF